MALYDGFAPPVNSTGGGSATDPASTGVVVATIDSTQLRIVTGGVAASRNTRTVFGQLTATLGGNSSFTWRIEQSASSTITDATKLSAQVWTPAHQSGVYLFKLAVDPGDQIRARGASTGTGTFTAFLQFDPLT